MMPPDREYTSDRGRNEMAPAAFWGVGLSWGHSGVKQKIEVSSRFPWGQLACSWQGSQNLFTIKAAGLRTA